MSLGDISGILALIMSGMLIVKAFLESKNLQRSGSNIDASTISTLQKSLKDAIESNAQMIADNELMRKDNEKLKLEIEAMKKKDMERDAQFALLMQSYEDLKEWTERLCKQLVDNRIEPVKMRTRTNLTM